MAKRSDATATVDDAAGMPRRRSAPVGGGGGGSDSDTEIEAPKRPRSAAQIAAFEKARERLAQSKAERAAANSKPATPAKPEDPEPEEPRAAAPVTVPEATPKARKPRSDKGKRRGTLRRLSEDELEDTASSAPRSHSPYSDTGGWSLDGMYRRHGQFIVV